MILVSIIAFGIFARVFLNAFYLHFYGTVNYEGDVYSREMLDPLVE